MSNYQNNDPQRDPGGEPPRPPFRMQRNAFGWILIFALAATLLFAFVRGMEPTEKIYYSDFLTHVKNGKVDEVVIRDDNTVIAKIRQGKGEQTKNFQFEVFKEVTNSDEFQKTLQNAPRPIRVEYKHQSAWLTILVQMLPFLLIIGLIWFLLFRQLRQSGGGAGMLGNFGRSRHRITTKEHTNVTFNDVAGIEEAKDEVLEIVEFLKNPKRFQRLGGRIPRGVLLIGEPGCGKTLLAKAIAGEADVPFFSISGSDFVEMFVGVGASRVRDLFKQAKENSPCIIFLDEIDAVGRRRGMGYSGGGHDEREQTLNAILVEMDGFESNDQVIVIAATNRADVLDPALIRPGRFDRQVYVPLPDVKGRFEILRVHARKVKMQPPIDKKLQRLAKATPMFSGADLAATINESALLATLASKDAIDMDDLEEARDKIRFGRAKKSRVVEDHERELTAYHEAGHAVVQTLLEAADPVHKVSIIPRGPYGGATFSLPDKDRMTVNRSFIDATMRVLCAGRLAEELLGQDMNSGAAGDIRQATNLAKQMITDWGMSDRLGFVYYGDDKQSEFKFGHEYSEVTSGMIDEEVKRIIDEAYQDTRRILAENRAALDRVAQALLKYETLTGDEVRAIIAGEEIDKPTVAELIAAEQERRQNEPPPVARPVDKPDEEPGGAMPHPA